jgi:transposase
LPPQYVKPFVKRSKTDSADAEAICETTWRSGIRDVPVKTCEQQRSLMLHRARDLLIRQRTMLTNALRGFAAEFGLVVGQGAWNIGKLRALLHTADDSIFPEIAQTTTQMLFGQWDELQRKIDTLEKRIMAWHRESPESRRLASIPGIGPINATLMAATVPDARQFRSGREFAAWIGQVPKESSSGGKQRLGLVTVSCRSLEIISSLKETDYVDQAYRRFQARGSSDCVDERTAASSGSVGFRRWSLNAGQVDFAISAK